MHESSNFPAEGLIVDVDSEPDLRFWAEVFGVWTLELRHAVRMVGPTELAVRSYLGAPGVGVRVHH
jgi:hypothetical protein